MHHDKRIFDAPIRGIGHVRHARHAVELDVVAARDRGEAPHDLATQVARLGELARERVHRGMRRCQQVRDLRVERRVAMGAPRLDLVQAVAHRFHQQAQPPRAVEEIVLQVRIAVHGPDIAEHFVEHSRRASGAPHATQLVERRPGRRAE